MRYSEALALSRRPVHGESRRIGLLSNFELDQVATYLRALGVQDNVSYAVGLSGFGNLSHALFAQTADWDLAAVVITLGDVFPELSPRTATAWSPEALERMRADAAERIGGFVSLLTSAASRWRAPMLWIMARVALPPVGRHASDLQALELRLSLALAEATAGLPGCRLAPTQRVPHDTGVHGAAAERQLFDAGIPFSLPASLDLARLLHEAAAPGEKAAPARKLVVTDLDMTAWAGTLGEDGADGISARAESGTFHFALYQNFLALLAAEGVLLAIASRNSREAVEQVLADENVASQAGLRLRLGDFSAVSCNYLPKAAQLRAICDELNLLPESVVYVDDDEAERFLVEAQLPGIACLPAPAPGSTLPLLDTLRGYFPFSERTAEDRNRADLYALRGVSEASRAQHESEEEFLRSLTLSAVFERVDDPSAVRPFQLYNKTNQFNMTGERLTADAWRDFLEDGDRWCLQATLEDRFGNHGVVLVALLETAGDTLLIRNLVMSCRVFNRTLETAFLHWLAAHFKDTFTSICGRYSPTKYNSHCADFYRRHGFTDDGHPSYPFVTRSFVFPDTKVDLHD